MILLLLRLALAEPDVQAPPAPPAPATTVPTNAPPAAVPPAAPLSAAPAYSPAALLDQAIELRQRGDRAASDRLLAELEPLMGPDLRGEWLYQRGVSAELAGDHAAAADLYRRSAATPGPRVADARMRLAYMLEELGRYEEALDQIALLSGMGGWGEADARALELQRGITELYLGEERRGLRRIEAALAALEGTQDLAWLRAKARYMLARHHYLIAADIPLAVRDRKAGRNLRSRALEMKAAEDEVIEVARLQQVEWVLASLILMGDAYRDLAAELRSAQPPKGLDSVQLLAWQNEIDHYADNAETKAWNAYDQGVQFATRLGWESPRLLEIRARRDEMGER